MTVLDALRDRVVDSATGLFKHADYPLARSLDYPGDPGLFGPESVSWRIIGDASAFLGGLRALLVQAAHQEVVAGVADHSRYREDPLGRLSRTSNYVTATTFGAIPEVERAVRVVRGAHRGVEGTSHRGRSYAADHPGMAAWVHNALTESFLTAYRVFGPESLSTAEADRFVQEQRRVGALLDADPMPETADELSQWIATHPAIGDSPGLREAVGFLRDPPLTLGVKVGYRVLFHGAVATLPARIRQALGVRRVPGAILGAKALIGFLRWSLGSSPTWKLALVRVGAPIPEGRFRQPLPTETLDAWGDGS
ncbi:MAG: oxygenase MpaB family protein [Acidimicrobiia bacterium]|nr:oxygenase MpaB family protein [Acidimicrobiia bacterium]